MMTPETGSAESAIKNQHHEATTALSKGDLASVMSVYADDVISLPPNQPARVGKAAVQSLWEETLTDFAVEVSVNVEEVEVAGGWAFERGTFDMKLSPRAGGAPIEDTGKYLDVLRQQADGSWKYARVSWNSSQPAT
jgi:ketosteroid isomerase-like protein